MVRSSSGLAPVRGMSLVPLRQPLSVGHVLFVFSNILFSNYGHCFSHQHPRVETNHRFGVSYSLFSRLIPCSPEHLDCASRQTVTSFSHTECQFCWCDILDRMRLIARGRISIPIEDFCCLLSCPIHERKCWQSKRRKNRAEQNRTGQVCLQPTAWKLPIQIHGAIIAVNFCIQLH